MSQSSLPRGSKMLSISHQRTFLLIPIHISSLRDTQDSVSFISSQAEGGYAEGEMSIYRPKVTFLLENQGSNIFIAFPSGLCYINTLCYSIYPILIPTLKGRKHHFSSAKAVGQNVLILGNRCF